jgi:hypothetical protein
LEEIMAPSAPKVTSIAVNAAGGAPTYISLTIMASKVRVQEDPSANAGAAQGLQGYKLDPQPPQESPPARSPNYLFTWLPNTNGQQGPAYQPIEFGGGEGGRVHGAFSEYVGAQGTQILELYSASETATKILLEEWA